MGVVNALAFTLTGIKPGLARSAVQVLQVIWLCAATAGALAEDDLVTYRGKIQPTLAEASLAADLQVSVPIENGQERITFFMNRGLNVEQLSCAGIAGFSRRPMPDNELWSLIELTLADDFSATSLSFRITYSGKLVFPEDAINGIGPDWVELSVDSAWYPVLSSLAYPVRAELLIDLPSEWTLVSSGEVTRTRRGWLLKNTLPQLDVAWVAAPDLQVYGGPDIRVFHRGLDSGALNGLVDRAAACRDVLNERLGSAGLLPPLRFVVAGRAESGYARKNYIVLTGIEGRPELDLTEFLCHELAHYWSAGAPPLSVDNWMNEGFAALLAADAIEHMYSVEAFQRLADAWRVRAADAGSIWTDDDRSRRSHAVNYHKAPLFLTRLRECMGAEPFEALLLNYASDPIDSTEQFLDAIERLVGGELRKWAMRQLGLSADLFMASSACPVY